MATNYPNDLDVLVNPQPGDSVQLVSHAAQHANANDAIEALQAKVGKNNSTDPNSIDYKVAQLLSYSLNYEQAQDAAAALLAHANHTNLIATYDDVLNEVRLSVAAPDVARTIYQTAVNQSSTTLTKGTPVYINGSIGASGKLTVTQSSNASEATSSKTFGLVAETLIQGAEGQIITEGLLQGINTVGANDGDAVWLGSNGTKVYGYVNKPVAPNHMVFLGIVVRGGHATNGSIFVKIQNGFELEEMHNVLISNPQNLNALVYNSTTTLWENYDLTQFLATKTYADTKASDARTAAEATAAAALLAHEQDTTNIHGIANTADLATKSYTDNAVSTAVANLINSAPAALDTLKELSDALASDPNFATTMTNALATKLDITTAASTYLALSDTDERIQDVVGGMVSGNTESSGLSVTYDDTAAKLNFSIDTASLPNFTEVAQDSVSTLFTHSSHSNITASYDDVNNKIIFTALPQLTQEQVQDYLAPLFTHGNNELINVTYDDEANQMILEAIIPPSKAIMSASAPSNPANGEFWFDLDEFRSGSTKSLKIYNALPPAYVGTYDNGADYYPGDIISYNGSFYIRILEPNPGYPPGTPYWSSYSFTPGWEYVSSDISLSTTNTWTAKNTFQQGVIIGLTAAPTSPVHGQIYYNTILDKLKVWDGLLWQDIQGSGGGGGLTLIPTDTTVPASTFFVGLIAPPAGAVTEGDLWIDVDDDAGDTEFIHVGAEPPADFGSGTLWVDTDEPDMPLIYSNNEPPTYSPIDGDLWIDLDDDAAAAILSSTTPPLPTETEFWLDLSTEEGYLTYSDLFKNGAAQIQNFASLPDPLVYPGMISYVSSENALYVATAGAWKKIYPTYDAEAMGWMGF